VLAGDQFRLEPSARNLAAQGRGFDRAARERDSGRHVKP